MPRRPARRGPALPGAGLACADVGDGHAGRRPLLRRHHDARRRDGEGWEPADYPHGTLLMARGPASTRSACSTSGTSPTARRPTSASAAAAGWEVGIVRTAEVRNPYLASAAEVVDYLMHRNTLLLVREHFGRYKATIRFSVALSHLADGLARPHQERPGSSSPADGCGRCGTTPSVASARRPPTCGAEPRSAGSGTGAHRRSAETNPRGGGGGRGGK